MAILYAILSDIHGNYQALREVRADAQRVARQEKSELYYICLGDIVNYGPQPNECVRWVTESSRVAFTVQGNHDRIAAQPIDAPLIELGRSLWPIAIWTRSMLREVYKRRLHGWPEWLQPPELHGLTLFHTNLDPDPARRNEYIYDPKFAYRTLNNLKTAYGLFGHSHWQGYFVDDLKRKETAVTYLVCAENEPLDGVRDIKLLHANDDRWRPFPASHFRTIFNPGSVGQPENPRVLQYARVPYAYDQRAAYMLLRYEERWSFQFRRVQYDIDETVKRLRTLEWPASIAAAKTADSDQATDSATTHSLPDWLTQLGDQWPDTVERLVRRLTTGMWA